MEFYDIEKDRYELRLGEVPAALYDIKEEYDVVLLLGFFYHTNRLAPSLFERDGQDACVRALEFSHPAARYRRLYNGHFDLHL